MLTTEWCQQPTVAPTDRVHAAQARRHRVASASPNRRSSRPRDSEPGLDRLTGWSRRPRQLSGSFGALGERQFQDPVRDIRFILPPTPPKASTVKAGQRLLELREQELIIVLPPRSFLSFRNYRTSDNHIQKSVLLLSKQGLRLTKRGDPLYFGEVRAIVN